MVALSICHRLFFSCSGNGGGGGGGTFLVSCAVSGFERQSAATKWKVTLWQAGAYSTQWVTVKRPRWELLPEWNGSLFSLHLHFEYIFIYIYIAFILFFFFFLFYFFFTPPHSCTTFGKVTPSYALTRS